MRRWPLVLISLATALGCFAQTPAQEQTIQQLRSLQWQKGPGIGQVGMQGSVKLPGEYVFLNDPETAKFLQIMGNPPSAGNYAFAPKSLEWFAVFHFDASGYVKDDEKIDPDALLKTLKESDVPANEERRKLGMEQLTTEGWLVPPHYDVTTKRLEWGLRLRGEHGDQTINYTTRLLGRSGVMAATLVSSPERVGADMDMFRGNLSGFSFNPGQAYTEYRSGDKVAEYGLGALVLGGAAAAAAKTGLLKSLGKFLWLGVLAVLAAISSLWKKITGRKD
jgi:uncharacterized membrane-anchored protein